MAAVRHLVFVIRMRGTTHRLHWWSEEALKIPTKSVEQVLRYSDFSVLKFWLTSPYSRSNFRGFSAVRLPKSGHLLSRPPKGTNCYIDTSFEPLRVKID